MTKPGGTMQHVKEMERGGLTDIEAWQECLREAARPRFDKRTRRTVPSGVFIRAVQQMREWDVERTIRMFGG